MAAEAAKAAARTEGEDRRTAGAFWGMMLDGFLIPPEEMAEHESLRMTMLAVMSRMRAVGYHEGKKIVFDMCHLLRWAMKRRHLHDNIASFVDKAQHAVDTFHFDKNHIGVVQRVREPPEGAGFQGCEHRGV